MELLKKVVKTLIVNLKQWINKIWRRDNTETMEDVNTMSNIQKPRQKRRFNELSILQGIIPTEQII